MKHRELQSLTALLSAILYFYWSSCWCLVIIIYNRNQVSASLIFRHISTRRTSSLGQILNTVNPNDSAMIYPTHGFYTMPLCHQCMFLVTVDKSRSAELLPNYTSSSVWRKQDSALCNILCIFNGLSVIGPDSPNNLVSTYSVPGLPLRLLIMQDNR